MSKNLILASIVSLGFLGGCTTPETATKRQAEEQPANDSNYPFSEIGKVYEAVLDGMTEKYFAKLPDLDRAHSKALRDFISSQYPREKFINEMVQPNYRPIFERAQREPAHRESKEFKDAFEITVNVSVPMAKMIIGGQRDIYVAKFVERNPMKIELFTMATTEDERQYISWVSGEVTVDDGTKIGEGSERYHHAEGDRVFEFSSPEETWANLCGRAGFLVVRQGKIAQVIVTMMN